MERFGILRNIDLITRRLGLCDDIPNREYFLSLICREQKRLAVIDSREYGASEHGPYSREYGTPFFDDCLNSTREGCEDSLFPCVIIDPRPGLKIIVANSACSPLLLGPDLDLVGRSLCDTALVDTETCDGGGFVRLFGALKKVMVTGAEVCLNERSHVCGTSRGQGERLWHIQISPIFDSWGDVILIRCEFLDGL